jgi:2-amino-4-hydroxy-6-hydroxymethyldihydropteridine diphosphokinase
MAYIAMGGNLPGSAGPPEATLTAAALHLETLGRITARSHLYSTLPVGFADQPRFVNAVVELETELDPRRLLAALLAIEHEFGRERWDAIRNGPRTLDLDILFYGNAEIREPGLEIPHPRLAERAFVLVPLCEIAPSLRHAPSGFTVKQLLHHLRVDKESDADAPIAIHWDDWPARVCGGDAGRAAPDGAVAHEPYGGG